MARELDPSRRLDREVRRVVRRRLRDAIALLRESTDGPERGCEEAVHIARRHGKEVRSLVRLLDADRDTGADLDRVVRDAGRSLAPLRDAHVAAAMWARTGLGAREETAGGVDERAAIEAAILRFDEALGLVDELRPADVDDRLRRGLRRTYSRCRRAYERARRHPTPRRLHRWRIWNKRLWYQVRFLAAIAPSVLVPLADLLDRVGEHLGDVHDLDVHLHGKGAGLDPDRCDALERERAAMVRRTVRWGATIHAEDPAAFATRLSELWAIARHDGPEPTP